MLHIEDIQNKEFKKTPLGYSVEEVDDFLDVILQDYHILLKENQELKDKVGVLSNSLEHYRSLESTIQKTLAIAEKTVDESKNSAYLKGEQMKREAELKAQEIVREAVQQIKDLEHELLRLKNQYESAKAKIRLLLATELDLLDKTEIFEKN